MSAACQRAGRQSARKRLRRQASAGLHELLLACSWRSPSGRQGGLSSVRSHERLGDTVQIPVECFGDGRSSPVGPATARSLDASVLSPS